MSASGLSADSSPGNAGNRSTCWTVGELLRAIAGSLEDRFNPITVSGELSGFSRATSGHCYFSLRDDHGQIRCALFRRAAMMVGFEPGDGQRVELRGRLGVYDQRGELQLIVESMRRSGEGDLFGQFLALKARLAQEGLFDQARKRPLPAIPRAIGVVTSLAAAALHDVVRALERRAPHVQVVVYPSIVQGVQAAGELREALQRAYRRNEVDVILLVRGGGSMEDLWAFNDEQLARTIGLSPMPLVCGLGHETDFTIADFCADLRAPTPTAAAELCAEPVSVLQAKVDRLSESVESAVRRQIDRQTQRLDRASDAVARRSHAVTRQHAVLSALALELRQSARSCSQRHNLKLDALFDSLPGRLETRLIRYRERIEEAQIRLGLLDPKLVLQRGYAWLSDMQGAPVTHAKSLRYGQPVRATLSDGEVDLTVTAPRLI